jgi:hypothetical protein
MTREEILDRLKKLLAVSRDNGATDNEANIAAGIARRLMNEHEITIEQVLRAKQAEDFANEQVDPTGFRRRPPNWYKMLAMGVAEGFDCKCAEGDEGRLHFLGFVRDAAVAAYLFRVLTADLRRAVRQASNRFCAFSPGTRRRFNSSFLIAAAREIQGRLKREKETGQSDQRTLVEAKREAIEAYFEPNLTKPRPFHCNERDPFGSFLGREAANKLSLNTNALGDQAAPLPAITGR